jgi:hypothetical protein
MPDVTAILRGLPYSNQRTTVLIRGQRADVKPTQIIIWASITSIDEREFNPATPRFPIILDTGLSHNFAIKEEHLHRWAGLDGRLFRRLHQVTIGGTALPLHEAEVWLHPNRTGERDQFAYSPPFRLQLSLGIAIYPRAVPTAPRLPLLGLRGLQWSDLHLSIDCEHRRVWLRTPRRFWFFGGHR